MDFISSYKSKSGIAMDDTAFSIRQKPDILFLNSAGCLRFSLRLSIGLVIPE